MHRRQIRTLSDSFDPFLFNSADTSIMIAWTAANTDEPVTVLRYEINPREEVNLKSLFNTLWDRTCWVQILAIDADGWDEFRKHPHTPSAAPSTR